MTSDPYAALKAIQREGWSSFAPLAAFTTPAADSLVTFAGIASGQRVLDVACGTGVVAITAAVRGAQDVCGLDLTPALIEVANRNAALCDVQVTFTEGDAEALPWPDASFDVVLSQFGHMFAPRPAVVIAEMLRVLKPGGRIAFSTWPPEFMIGRLFDMVGEHVPGPPGVPASTAWGKVDVIRERLGAAVRDLEHARDEMIVPALSPRHYQANMEHTAAPFIKLVQVLTPQPDKLAAVRAKMEAVIGEYFARNRLHQQFLMTRAIKV